MNSKSHPIPLKKWFFLIPIVGMAAISIILSQFSPEEIVNAVGTSNAYALMFVLAMIGGISTFTAVPYQLVLMGFAAGGINPLLLGTITALGVMVGDSTSYFIGRQSGNIMPEKMQNNLGKITELLLKKPKLITPILIAYGGFSPFSNDFIVISMGMIRYSYWKVILPLTTGNIFYNVGLAYLGYYSFETIQSWF